MEALLKSCADRYRLRCPLLDLAPFRSAACRQIRGVTEPFLASANRSRRSAPALQDGGNTA
jgi:hypothetical protein